MENCHGRSSRLSVCSTWLILMSLQISALEALVGPAFRQSDSSPSLYPLIEMLASEAESSTFQADQMPYSHCPFDHKANSNLLIPTEGMTNETIRAAPSTSYSPFPPNIPSAHPPSHSPPKSTTPTSPPVPPPPTPPPPPPPPREPPRPSPTPG